MITTAGRLIDAVRGIVTVTSHHPGVIVSDAIDDEPLTTHRSCRP